MYIAENIRPKSLRFTKRLFIWYSQIMKGIKSMETAASRPVTEEDLPGIGDTLTFEGHIKKRQTGIWYFHRIPFPKGLNNITSGGWSEVNARGAGLALGAVGNDLGDL